MKKQNIFPNYGQGFPALAFMKEIYAPYTGEK